MIQAGFTFGQTMLVVLGLVAIIGIFILINLIYDNWRKKNERK